MTAKVRRCPTCGRREKRSTEANRRYWLILHLIAERIKPGDNLAYSPDQWHLYFKSRFLGADDVDLPNGKTLVIPHSSADLSTEEFSDYAMKVEAWASERDVYLDEIPA